MANDPAYAHPEALVSTDWLAAHLDDRDLRVIDATYHLPTAKRDARAEFFDAHIPHAQFFDVDGISDRESDLPHMLPKPAEFAAAVEDLGVGDGDLVVCYDTYGLMSAARAWWMFRIFGHDRVAVLDGGFPKWRREGRPIDNEHLNLHVRPLSAGFTPRFRPEMVRRKADILGNIEGRAAQVLDARSAGRFRGTDPEPRPGLRGGRIPGSRNLSYNLLLDDASKTLLPAADLKARFADAGIDPARPVITSCGSGVTACALALGLHLIGAPKVAVYDGSWSEWGLPGETPVETG